MLSAYTLGCAHQGVNRFGLVHFFSSHSAQLKLVSLGQCLLEDLFFFFNRLRPCSDHMNHLVFDFNDRLEIINKNMI